MSMSTTDIYSLSLHDAFRSDYAMMVEDSHVETKLVEYRAKGPDSRINGRGAGALLGVALTDVLSDGLSMVYSDRKSTRLNSSHTVISYAVFCLKKKNISKT